MRICDSKVLYDTEFEAIVRAAKRTKQWGEEMMPYPCGTHWHIAHKDKTLRNKHIRILKDYCEDCGCKMRPTRYMKHITLPGHLKRATRKRKET